MGTVGTTNYSYHDGRFRSELPADRADLCFAWIEKTLPDGEEVRSFYTQSSDPAEARYLARVVEAEEVYGSDGMLYSRIEYEYATRVDDPAYPRVRHRYHTNRYGHAYDGIDPIDRETAPRVSRRVEYAPPDTYGNLASLIDYGEVDTDGNDILEDKTEAVTEYAIDTSRWLFLPTKQTVSAYGLAGSFAVASEKRFFYYAGDSDNDFGDAVATAGNPGTKGLVARIEYENGADDTSQQFAYYPHGNLWKTKDGRGNVASTLEYDSDYDTLVTTTTNALGLQVVNIPNGLMQLEEVKNERQISRYLRYDVFGRLARTWDYGDSNTSPTKRQSYSDSAALPASPVYVDIEARNAETDYLFARTYLDGLGRKVQIKDRARDHGAVLRGGLLLRRDRAPLQDIASVRFERHRLQRVGRTQLPEQVVLDDLPR